MRGGDVSADFSVARYLREVLLDQHRPCFFVLDKDFRLLHVEGDADYFGYAALATGEDCRDALPFLFGLAADEAIHLPLVETASGRAADLLLTPVEGKLGLLLTDASRERAARQASQQQANEIRLLHKQQQKLVEALRRARDELEIKHRQAEDASRMKSRFIASLSHELRTPLTGILGHAGLLTDPQGSAEPVAESARLIEFNANHLLSLVDNVLDQASLEMGQLALHPVPVRLASLCREIQAMFAPLAAARGLELRIHRRGNLPTWTELDATRLRQVLINLVGNGIKYTERGFVALILKWERGQLEVGVGDSGPGIPQSARKRIFLPFHREKEVGNKQGAGLGLAISAQLVELMGGRLELEDRSGGGSVFRFAVPAPQIGDASARVGGRDTSGRRILIVDDSADIRALYTRVLEKEGFVVDGAADEPEAWRRFEDNRPDLVLVDLYLTEWEGRGLVRRLRGRGFTGGVVAWSASSLREDRQGALDAGADAFLVKPVAPSVMVASLNEILRRGSGAAE
jgi:signal transduction histidine kinase